MSTAKENLNKQMTAVLYKYFPQTKELANFLIDTLDLSKESAYRRLRNEVYYTFEEIVILCQKLELSIDKIAGVNAKKAFLDMPLYKAEKPEEIYKEIIEWNIRAIKKIYQAKDSIQYTVLNRLPHGITMYSEPIAKFQYYKWYIHKYKGKVKTPFHEFEVPECLNYLFREYFKTSEDLTEKMRLILDENIFLYLIKEIQYCRDSNFIDSQSLEIMKEELYKIVDLTANVARTGTNKSNADIKIYLSGVDIEPNYTYAEYDDNIIFFIWSPSGEIVTSTNPEFCARQKDWIDSLMRYTTLITQCNEIKQLEFFDKQRKYISEMK